MKYIIIFVSLFSSCLLVTYRPMSMRTINFGDDVCYYKDISHDSNLIYVKPCEEDKRCVSLGISEYQIHTCQANYDEVYDNRGETCVSKDYINGIDCTDCTCNSNGKCGETSTCTESQVWDIKNGQCVDDPGYCYEYEENHNHISKKEFTPFGNKECAQIELKAIDSNKGYEIIKEYSNYIASIEDGKYINNDKENYCQSGFALYFFGGEQLKNPDTETPDSEKMFLRCVTVLGKDENGIIKYKIGSGQEMYYDPQKLPKDSNGAEIYRLNKNDDYLMLRLELFSNYKNRLDSLSNCRETDCEDNELNKWHYFYNNPKEYLLYKNEPEVIGYLLQSNNYKYSINGANTLGKINSLIVLLLFLFI